MYHPSAHRPGILRLVGWIVTLGFVAGLPGHAAEALKAQPSAFLRSYADSPVDWMVWGEAAFARAKREQKPVLLVIGTFTSELSRAMHRQTFSNRDTAAFLNDSFVCVLVDAKEQPEVTALYRNYLQTVKQLSGYPMNLWLTPELKPFEGANYLPPTEEWGKEGFSTVAKRAAAGWQADPTAQRAKADEAVALFSEAALPVTEQTPAELKQRLEEATEAWKARFDSANGGFGEPPKYPEPELMSYLLRDPASQDMALTTLRKVISGAVRDPLDGGFFRYAIDAEGRYPYFQKSLPDQARLALALLDAAKVSGDAQFGHAARAALLYALTQRRDANGDFSAAEDATPEAITPSYFWTLAQIRDVLGDAQATAFSAAYQVTAEGNIPPDTIPGMDTTGKNILYRTEPISGEVDQKALEASAAKLLAKRELRAPALRDDGATSGMHGLLLTAFSRAAAQLQDDALKTAADEVYAFVRRELVIENDQLRRLAGRSIPGVAEDYALIIAGLSEYAAVAKNSLASELAGSLGKSLHARFWEPAAGRYVATTLKPEAGIWARVTAPSAGAADLPTPEGTMLKLLLASSDSNPAEQARFSVLQQTVATDIKDAVDVARGDLLLALSTSLQR